MTNSLPKFQPFTRLTSNVKRQELDLELGPLTVVTGEEASGKSAIGQSIELALVGKTRRVGVQPSELLKLALDKTQGICSRLTGPSGSAEWLLTVENGKAHKAPPPVFTGDLARIPTHLREFLTPAMPMQEVLGLGPTKLREKILQRWGEAQKIEVPAGLMPDQVKLWEESIAAVRQSLKLRPEENSPTLLSDLTGYFRKTSLALRRTITEQEKALAQRKEAHRQVKAPTVAVASEMLPAYERQLQELELWEKLQGQRDEIEQALYEAREKERTFRQEVLDCQAAEQAQKVKFEGSEGIGAKLQQARQSREAYLLLGARMEERLAASKLSCALCVQSLAQESIARIAETLKKNAQKRAGEILTLEQEYATEQSALTLVSLQRMKAERRWDEAQDHVKDLESELKEVGDPKVPGVTMNVEELRAAIAWIKAQTEGRLAIERSALSIRQQEQTHANLKVLEKEAQAMQTSILASSLSEIVSADLTKHMPGGRKVIFDEQAVEFTVIGTDGTPHAQGFMCGTEETDLLFAWTAAWTADAPLRFPVFDDRDLIGLSQKGWRDVFDACERAVAEGYFTQVLVICPIPSFVPTNWTVIKRG